MPNYCTSTLIIRGDKTQIDLLCSSTRGKKEVLDFNQIVPYPNHFAEADRVARIWNKYPKRRKSKRQPKDGFNNGGYEWCLQCWGTKWNVIFPTIEKRRDYKNTSHIEICFDTAWSPPLPIMVHLSIMFPMLKFDLRYHDEGYSFAGRFICAGGEVIKSDIQGE